MREDSNNPLDVHETITNSIVVAIEAGAGNARLPWHRTGASSILPKNAATGNAYNGINVLVLWATAQERAYTHSLWGTYKQFQSLDAQVRKGEKASLIVFYKEFDVAPDPQQEHDDGRRRVAKASWVFNVAQVDGYSVGAPLPPLPPLERDARAETFVAATGAEIRIGGESAYYRPSTDHIQMPDENLFREADSEQRTQDWYSVLTHELGHFTGHEKRLNRQFGKRFADSAYCMEELTAELCSAFLCAELGFTVQPRTDHAHYIGHWLRVMKADKRADFTAAAAASAAVRYLHNRQA
jgi:antirestriction protein ArdC